MLSTVDGFSTPEFMRWLGLVAQKPIHPSRSYAFRLPDRTVESCRGRGTPLSARPFLADFRTDKSAVKEAVRDPPYQLGPGSF